MKKILLPALIFALLSFKISTAQTQDAPPEPDFYDLNTIQEIKLSFAQENWRYFLDSLRYNGDGLFLGSVEINGQPFENVGVRYQESKSFTPGGKRNSLEIELNYINKNQNFQGHPTIVLSNSLRDPSMIREVLSFEIARNYMPAPKANYAWVTVNGENDGLFVNIEAVDDVFLDAHFGSSENALFKVNPFAGDNTPAGCRSKIFGSLEYDDRVSCYLNNFKKLSEHGWDDLMELTKALNEQPGKIESVLNVDRTLWMLAFNNVLVNLSSYSGQHSVNYYLYKDDRGQFNPVIWHLNLAFGSFKNTGQGSDLKLKDLQNLDPLLHLDAPSKPLISKLLQNEFLKKVYLSHLETILQDFFTNGKYLEQAKTLRNLIREDFKKDPRDDYSLTDFDNSMSKTIGKRSKIPGLVELMEKRVKYLKRHPALEVLPPDISEVNVIGRPQFSSERVKNFRVVAKVDKFPKRVKLVYRLSGEGDFRVTTMYDDGKNNDGQSNDGTFGTTINPENGESVIEYYILAENATLVNYSPANYMWERHRASLEELNK